ncbi:MAG: FecCD family ABC transporter permease [Campylobacterota bacterium]
MKTDNAIIIVTVVSLVLFALSIFTGSEGIVFDDFKLYLQGDLRYAIIFEQIRIPRALAAFFAGAALALSGVLLQAVLKNPLASPFTLGISQASAFGASFAIIVLQSYSGDTISAFATPLAAFCASLLCIFTIVFLGKRVQMQPSSLILAGVAIGALFNSMTMFLQFFANEVDVAATLFWTFGDVGKATFISAAILAVTSIIALVGFYAVFWKFDAILLGDAAAQTLGVDSKKLQIISLIAASLLSALTVSFLGVIGFIGLIAPHIVRLFIGSTHKLLLPLSMLCGGSLLLLADIASRIIIPSSLIPVGILTSFLGAPLFLYLISRKRAL